MVLMIEPTWNGERAGCSVQGPSNADRRRRLESSAERWRRLQTSSGTASGDTQSSGTPGDGPQGDGSPSDGTPSDADDDGQQLSEPQCDSKMKRIFDLIDVGGDGALSLAEFIDHVDVVGVPDGSPSEEEDMREVMCELDDGTEAQSTAADDKISLNEFQDEVNARPVTLNWCRLL